MLSLDTALMHTEAISNYSSDAIVWSCGFSSVSFTIDSTVLTSTQILGGTALLTALPQSQQK